MLCHAIDDRRVTAYGLALLAVCARAREDVARAGRLWGAVEAEEARASLGWSKEDIHRFGEQALANPSAELEVAVEAGRRLSLDEAVEYALSVDSRA